MTLFSSATEWPVLGEFDVVVAGAGPAGFGAAIAAARAGSRVVLLEKASFVGGMATQANCPHIMGMSLDGRQLVGGVADELCRELDALGHGRIHQGLGPTTDPLDGKPFTADLITTIHGIQLVSGHMLHEAGVYCLFHTHILEAVREGDRLTAVAVDCREGLGLIRGKTFVDATGDGLLIRRSGGRGRPAAAEDSMTKTVLFDFGGVDNFDQTAVIEAFNQQVRAGTIPVKIQDRFMGFRSIEPGLVHINFTAVVGDSMNSADLTRMDRELRDQVEAATPWFRQYIPGFE
ncbi:MAG: FAD-dependent oxidoreductase, partial [Planctomycetes bacterium]|nr:FAD-dependent oxidoreductase [Planctomycetota bacterium]